MSAAGIECGRLALRVEGDWWVAYYALSITSMEGAVELARIGMVHVEDEERKEAFRLLMQDVVSDMIETITGDRPVWPDGPRRAPEYERAGRG